MCLNLAQFLIVSVLEDHHTLKKYQSKLCYKVKQEYRELQPPNILQLKCMVTQNENITAQSRLNLSASEKKTTVQSE